MSSVRVAIAGSTGSIGTQTLDVVRAEAGDYEVVALGVGSSVEALIEQALEFRPSVVAVADEWRRAEVAAALPFAEVVADIADVVGSVDVVVQAARLRDGTRRITHITEVTYPSRPMTSVMCVMRRVPSRRRAAWITTSTDAQIISRIVFDGRV